jgi:hypothetical protein
MEKLIVIFKSYEQIATFDEYLTMNGEEKSH